RIRSINSIINDLERIGDIYFQRSKSFEDMQADGTELPEPILERIKEMLDLVFDGIRHVRYNLSLDEVDPELKKAKEIEVAIDSYRNELKDFHYSQLEQNAYSNKAGFVFLDYVNRLDKLCDNLFNINEAIAGVKVKAAYETVIEERG